MLQGHLSTMGLAWSTTDPRSMHDTASAAAPALNGALGYSFRDQALLQAALIHTSYVNSVPVRGLESNERLEFLGDAVLGVIVATGCTTCGPSRPRASSPFCARGWCASRRSPAGARRSDSDST